MTDVVPSHLASDTETFEFALESRKYEVHRSGGGFLFTRVGGNIIRKLAENIANRIWPAASIEKAISRHSGSPKGTYLNMLGSEVRPARVGSGGVYNPLLGDVDKGLWQQETHFFIEELLSQ